MTGRLIAFEGGEGTGKSTQAQLLAGRLDARFTFEPGDTRVGQRIRELVLDPEHTELDARAEALLMAADRAQHVAEVVRPTLATGRHVVTDRYIASSLVYQGSGRDLGEEQIDALSRFATDGLEADVVVLLEVGADEVQARVPNHRDRLEAAGVEFHERVRRGFADLAARHGWVVIDGTGSVEEVHERVWTAVAGLIDG